MDKGHYLNIFNSGYHLSVFAVIIHLREVCKIKSNTRTARTTLLIKLIKYVYRRVI